jgi:Pheromone A receptor
MLFKHIDIHSWKSLDVFSHYPALPWLWYWSLLGHWPSVLSAVSTAVRSSSLLKNLITGSCSGLNMYHIWTKRRIVKSMLGSSSGGRLEYDTCIKLFIISGIDILAGIPLNIYAFTTWFPVKAWPGWKAVHSTWSRIIVLTTAEWKSDPIGRSTVEGIRLTSVGYGFVFFFFGLSYDAWETYTSGLGYLAKRIGYEPRKTDGIHSRRA